MKSLYAGLEDYWTLHEASGNRFSAIGKNQLTDNGTVTQNPGKVVYAGQFTRANSEFLSLVSNAAVQAGDIAFTFCCWAYKDSSPAGQMYIISKDGTTSGEREYALFWDNTANRFQFTVFKATDSSMTVSATTLGAPSNSTWYFIMGWHDPDGNTVNIEVNVSGVDSTATTGALQAVSTGEFGIGAREGGTLFFDGRICEVGFWKRVLTVQERWWLYNRGLGRTYPFDGRISTVGLLGRDIYHRRTRRLGVIG